MKGEREGEGEVGGIWVAASFLHMSRVFDDATRTEKCLGRAPSLVGRERVFLRKIQWCVCVGEEMKTAMGAAWLVRSHKPPRG